MNQMHPKCRPAPWRRLAVAAGAVLLALSQVVAFAPQPALARPAAQEDNPEVEIVYIDGNGEFIRVIDPHQTGTAPEVRWVSPVGGWYELGLGDVNADGDKEIIAVGGTDADNSKLVIYDPVSRQGTPDGEFNGIPWRKLYETNLPFRPRAVAAGNFDANVEGDEILVSMEVPEGDGPEEDDRGRIDIFKAGNTPPDGTNWVVHIGGRYINDTFTRTSVGDVIPGATDEIVLVAEDSSNLEVYRVDTGWRRFFDPDGDYKDGVIGQILPGGSMEVAGVREQDPPGLALLVWVWDSTQNTFSVSTDPNDAFDPQPRRMALADVNGNGDKEIFMLRNFDGDGARLLGRNRGGGDGDGFITWEEPLDDDNGFRTLTGGDLDGDGRDELIIIRENAIRIYTETATSSDTYTTRNVSTNRRTVLTGDLDAVGFIRGAQFATNVGSIEVNARAGEQKDFDLLLSNSSTQEGLPYTITVEGNPDWLLVNPLIGMTPSDNSAVTIDMTFNATNLLPGIYRSRLIIDSSAEVINAPLELVVTFTVGPAELRANPSVILATHACSASDPFSRVIQIEGTANVVYTAAIVAKPQVDAALAALGGAVAAAEVNDAGNLVLRAASGAEAEVELKRPFVKGMTPAFAAADWPSAMPWVSASSEDGVVPDALTLTFTPANTTADFEEAWLILVGDERAGIAPANVRLIPIFYMCDPNQLYLVPTTRP